MRNRQFATRRQFMARASGGSGLGSNPPVISGIALSGGNFTATMASAYYPVDTPALVNTSQTPLSWSAIDAAVTAATPQAYGRVSVTGAGAFNLSLNTGGMSSGSSFYLHVAGKTASGGAGTDTVFGPFSYDAVAANLTSAGGSGITATGDTWSVTTDKGAGQLYVVYTPTNSAPSAAQMRAGQTSSGAAAPFSASVAVSSTGTKTGSSFGLSASTPYYRWFMQDNDSFVPSSVTGGSTFTTNPSTGPSVVQSLGIQGVAGSTVTVTFGATPTAGNKIFLFCTCDLSHTFDAAPSGYTLVANTAGGAGDGHFTSIYQKTATGSETSASITASFAAAVHMAAVEVSNVTTITGAAPYGTANSTSITTTSITDAVNDVLISMFCSYSATISALPASGTTNIGPVSTGGNRGVGLAHEKIASGTTSTPRTATASAAWFHGAAVLRLS